MKQFNDLARKVSKFHEEGHGEAKKASNPSDPDSEIPATEHTKTPDEMHSELTSMICPDCHSQVKAMMVKHGLMKNPNDSEHDSLPPQTSSAPEHKPSLSSKLK